MRSESRSRYQLKTGATDARSDDTSKLKVAVAEWLNARRTSPTDPGACLDPRDRNDRGISNDYTGRLLCPIDYDWEDLGYVDQFPLSLLFYLL